MFEVSTDEARRTVKVRMSGFMQMDEMKDFATAYRAATDVFKGGKHLVLADMRGLKALAPDVASTMTLAIGYARTRGVAACAHVSDSTIARLQAARVASEASPQDDVTIDCASIEDAHRVMIELRIKHFMPAILGVPR